jgi:hypothetical protein
MATDGRDNPRRERRHEQRGQGAVIQAQFGSIFFSRPMYLSKPARN